jgi:hypothetical protein
MGRLSPLLQWAFLRLLNTVMEYKLYTTVDITATGQYRTEVGKERDRWKEQNFQTVIQTLGIRANVSYFNKPIVIEVSGNVIGFETTELIRVWRFDFYTERDHLFEFNNDPVGYLLEDFDAVPYIAGLDESMKQNYNVFVTDGTARNIIFHKK